MTQQSFFPDDYLDELVEAWHERGGSSTFSEFMRVSLSWSRDEILDWIAHDQVPNWWFNNYWTMGGPK